MAKSCPTLYSFKDCSTLGSPILHCLPEFAQIHIHWVSDAIQPFHPLLTPSPPALNLSQHLSLGQWVGSSHQVPRVLELQVQRQFFQQILRIDLLWGWLVLPPRCPRDPQMSSPAPQFKSNNSPALICLYGPTLTCIHDYWRNQSFDCCCCCGHFSCVRLCATP